MSKSLGGFRVPYGTYKTAKATFWPWLSGKSPYNVWEGTTRVEDAQGTPTQSHIPPSILVYEDKADDFPKVTHCKAIDVTSCYEK